MFLLISFSVFTATLALVGQRDDPSSELVKLIGDRAMGKPTDDLSLSTLASCQIMDSLLNLARTLACYGALLSIRSTDAAIVG